MIEQRRKAIERLDAIDGSDPEMAHAVADLTLIAYLEQIGHGEVVEAYNRVIDRCSWWACA